MHTYYKMFLKDVYSQTRHVSVQLGTIIRNGTENKTLSLHIRVFYFQYHP
jgi:hypothetical protein